MAEQRSVCSVVSHYRKIVRRMDPIKRVEFLLELVGTRTALVRTYVALYKKASNEGKMSDAK